MPQPITPDAVYELTGVSDPSLSPAGDRVVFVKTKVDRDAMEARSHIMMMSLPDGGPVVFTQGKKDGAPSFSPDGRHLAFIRPDAKGQKQLWLIPVDGGEPRQLTEVPGGVSDPAWSPDSRHLAFVSDFDPDRLPDDHDPKKDPKTRAVRRVRYRFDDVGWRGDAFRHIFVVDTPTGETRQLTDGEGDDAAPAWSPDGNRIAFISDQRDDRDFTHFNDVCVMPADGGPRQVWSEGLYAADAIAWSPDGRRLAVIGAEDPAMWDPRQRWLFVIEPGMPPRSLTDGSYTPAPRPHWADAGRILFVADSRGQSFLCEASADSGEFRTIAGGGVQLSGLALDGAASKAVVVAASPRSSGELELVDTARGSRAVLTEYNRQYLEKNPPAAMEKFSLVRGGFDIESRLLLPPDLDPSRRYPLVLDIHGGPQGRFADSIDLTHQVLATSGYVVLAVNPRGSSSYGPEFANAVFRDWGGEDYLDIMAAVDEVCQRPYIDSDRLGVHGYSYGGFMGSWIVGHDTRFSAAVVGAPCINLVSMYGTSDIGVSFGDVQWGGSPVGALDALLERSPLTYAGNVETPVLLMHGEDDLRCPIGQSEEYFVALKRLGKEVELVRFPASGHLFRRTGHPKLQAEYLRHIVAWFDRYVGARPREVEAAEAVASGD